MLLGAPESEGDPVGWREGMNDSVGLALGPLDGCEEGFAKGRLDSCKEIVGEADGMLLGAPESEGNPVGWREDMNDSVGFTLGVTVGAPEMEGE